MLVSPKNFGCVSAKNLILAGPHRVSLWDPTPACARDLSSQFYLSVSELGRSRAAASLRELGSVNGNVKVELLDSPQLTDAAIAHFHVVVFCNVEDLALIEHVSSYCHAHKIKFILAESRGLFGSVFVDMGEHFVVKDIDGEEREAYTVTSVSASEVAGKTRITIAEGARIEFQTGATVVLRELRVKKKKKKGKKKKNGVLFFCFFSRGPGREPRAVLRL